MVNRGPSKGCYSCRSRKIRCSQGQPGCIQCARAGRPCPGYQNGGGLNIRLFEPQANNAKSRRCLASGSGPWHVQPPSSNRHQPLSSTAQALPRALEGEEGQTHPILKTLALGSYGSRSWERLVVSRFLYQHTFTPPDQDDGSYGWLDFVAPIYQQESDTGCFRAAVLAASNASIAVQLRLPGAKAEAWSTYGTAIAKLNKALADPLTALTDETLASVLMLVLCESLTGDTKVVVNSHEDGICTLSSLRGPDQINYPQGLSLYRHACSLSRSLETGELKRRVKKTDYTTLTGCPKSILISFGREVVEFYDWCSETLSSCPEGASLLVVLEEIALAGVKLRHSLTQWYEALPDTWKPRHLGVPSSLEQYAGLEYLLTFTNLSQMTCFHIYHRCRISVHETLLLCYQKIARLPQLNQGEQVAQATAGIELCKNAVTGSIGAICATIPYVLEEVDYNGNVTNTEVKKAAKALISLWAIWNIEYSSLATAQQQQHATKALYKIEEIWGIKIAAHITGRAHDDPGRIFLS